MAATSDRENSPVLVEPRLSDSSVESCQTEDTLPEGLAAVVGKDLVDSSKNVSESADGLLSTEYVDSRDQSGNLSSSTTPPVADNVDSTAAEFNALKIGFSAGQQEAVSRGMQGHAPAGLDQLSNPSHTVAPAVSEQAPASQPPTQDNYAAHSAYPQYGAYQNQFQSSQPPFSGMQDTSTFHASKMYYNSMDMASQSALNMDPSNRNGGMLYQGKSMPAPKQPHPQQQQQQPNWQSTMMNSYGMLAPNMYMTPQQVEAARCAIYPFFTFANFTFLTCADAANHVHAGLRDGNAIRSEFFEWAVVQRGQRIQCAAAELWCRKGSVQSSWFA